MCISATKSTSSETINISRQNRRKSLRNKVQIHGLNRRKGSEEKMGTEIEVQNLKLYMENISILEENEKLMKKASLLHQENLYLISEFQKRLTFKSDGMSTTLSQLLRDQ
ncbi:Protein LITTLE ZIPPER like [Heracleum sosnowskyi]|uniref:Protein LITTLE ZIPPER like n=1 Tax=Heracleum sosnowskyi TaxID=360622 RepID=A0AAD8HWV8_9APIA|nr:Protein LITTLE ZIPPER like [Heracleum sosnowskyi]